MIYIYSIKQKNSLTLSKLSLGVSLTLKSSHHGNKNCVRTLNIVSRRSKKVLTQKRLKISNKYNSLNISSPLLLLILNLQYPEDLSFKKRNANLVNLISNPKWCALVQTERAITEGI